MAYPYVFIAVHLAKRERLALGPIYLRSFFYKLDECVQNIVKFIGRYHVMTHVITVFMQIFLWGLFGKLSLKPTQYDAMEMMEMEENGQVVERPTKQKPLGVKQNNNMKLI